MAATKTIVTRDIAFVGMRVCRGKDWDYGLQDMFMGKQMPGTITEIRSIESNSMDFKVLWDGSKVSNAYSGGYDNKYHLYLWEDDAIDTKPPEDTKSEKNAYGNYPAAGKGTWGEVFNTGDTVEFVRHIHDSDNNSALKLEHGKTYKIKEFGSMDTTSYGKDYVYIERGNGWQYSSQCFRKVKSMEEDKKSADILSKINVGDEVKLYSHSTDSEGAGFVVGNWYKVVNTIPFIVERPSGGKWVIPPVNFSEVRASIKPARKRLLTLSDVNIGDDLLMYHHYADSEFKLKIGSWYRVMEIKEGAYPGPICVSIVDSYGKFTEKWFAKLECFDNVMRNYRSGVNVKNLLPGDSITYMFPIGPGSGKLKVNSSYIVVSVEGDIINVKSSTGELYGVLKYCFGGDIERSDKKEEKKKTVLEEMRDKMADKTSKGDDLQMIFKKGDWVKCVKVGTYEKKNKVEVGDIFEVEFETTYFTPEGRGIAGKAHEYSTYMPANNFILVPSPTIDPMQKKEEKWIPKIGEWVECISTGTWETSNGVRVGDLKMIIDVSSGSIKTKDNLTGKDYWMLKTSFRPAKKSAIISSSIKIKNNDRHKSRVSSIPGVSGSTFKVRSPVATFRKGQVHRGSAVRIRTSKARSGRAHS